MNATGEQEGFYDPYLDCTECGEKCKDQDTRIFVSFYREIRQYIREKVGNVGVDTESVMRLCEACAENVKNLALPVNKTIRTLKTKADFLVEMEELEEIIKADLQFSRKEDPEASKAPQKPDQVKAEPDIFCKKCGKPWELDETMIDISVQRSILLANVPGIGFTDAVDDEHLGPFCEACAAKTESIDIPLKEMLKRFKTKEEYYKSPDRVTIGTG